MGVRQSQVIDFIAGYSKSFHGSCSLLLMDVPERKQDLVIGYYEMPAPLFADQLSLKVIGMLVEMSIKYFVV